MAVKLDGAQAGRYNNANLSNQYVVNSGTFVLPVAEEAPTDPTELANWKPLVVVKAHAPYRLRKVNYAAKKEVTPPILPAPEDSGAFVLLTGSVSLPHPKVRPGGDFVWTGATEYYMAEVAPVNSEAGMVLGGLFDAFDLPTQAVTGAGVGIGLGVAGNSLPTSVRESGNGPKAGWVAAQSIDLNNPAWDYREPSYFPSQLFSSDLLCGINGYYFPFNGYPPPPPQPPEDESEPSDPPLTLGYTP